MDMEIEICEKKKIKKKIKLGICGSWWESNSREKHGMKDKEEKGYEKRK